LPNRYPPTRTGLLLVDLYNDCLCEGGKLWPEVRAVAEQVDLADHLRVLADTARRLGITVFHVPHRRWREGDFDAWRHPMPWQLTIDREALFADGTWGGDWHPDLAPQDGDVIVQEHWGQNGFVNTDLDLQLKQRGIEHVVVVGTMAAMCVATTARHAAELGYLVTLVRDATVAMSDSTMRFALDVDGPTFAHNIVTTAGLVAALTGGA
jgi:nicotinamidase-related amidase